MIANFAIHFWQELHRGAENKLRTEKDVEEKMNDEVQILLGKLLNAQFVNENWRQYETPSQNI